MRVLGPGISSYYLKAEPKDSSSEKVPLTHTNPISGYFRYVTSVTKIRRIGCVIGHPVS